MTYEEVVAEANEAAAKLAILILITICVLPLVISLVDSMITCSAKEKELKIKFDTFMSFYEIAPHKWTTYGYYVVYHASSQELYEFSFKFIDSLRYEHWRKKKDKEARKRIAAESYVKKYSDVIEYIKNDISDFRQQNQSFIDDKMQEIRKYQNIGRKE